MSKETDAKKALLATQLEHAVVEERDGGYYRVYVPGGFREENLVLADSPEAAVEKVKGHLSAKIDQYAKEQVYTGSDEPQEGDVTVQPENLKVKMKATVRPATEEEING